MSGVAIADPKRIAPSVLAGLSNLELIARTAAEGTLLGLHRSPQPGFSQEFAEYRPYEPGDDFRHVDWNVYARSEKTYVKRYLGDTNHNVVVLMDSSGSMAATPSDRGSVHKSDYARFLSAALVYLAHRQHDAVGLLTFDAEIRDWLSPGTRSNHIHRIYHSLEATAFAGATDWQSAMDHIQARLNRRSLLVLVSDFYLSPESLEEDLRALTARGHDLLLFHVLDVAERSLPATTTLEDAESGRVMVVSDDARAYEARLAKHLADMRRMVIESRGHYVNAFTDEPLNRVLADYLRYRAREM